MAPGQHIAWPGETNPGQPPCGVFGFGYPRLTRRRNVSEGHLHVLRWLGHFLDECLFDKK